MRKTVIPRSLPKAIQPHQAVREYYRHLKRYSDKFASLLKFALTPAIPTLKEVAKNELPDPHMDSTNFYELKTLTSKIRMDTNIDKRIADILNWVERELNGAFSEELLRSWVRSMVSNTNTTSKQNTLKVTKAVDLDIEPLLHDRNLNPFFNNIIDENVGLIKSIPKYQMQAFKNKLVFAISKDATQVEIQKIISNYIGSSGNVSKRAKLIARDQVGKLNASLNKYRQQQLGGTRYIWRSRKGERSAGNPSGLYPHAKPSHWAREGKTYSWSKPPEGGHPGERVNCGCHAEMVIEDVLK